MSDQVTAAKARIEMLAERIKCDRAEMRQLKKAIEVLGNLTVTGEPDADPED